MYSSVTRLCEISSNMLKLGFNESDIDFWSSDERQWLVDNIGLSNRNVIENWKTLFCVACWLIWRRRNEVIHNNSCPCFDEGVTEIRGIVRCMLRARELLEGSRSCI